MKKVLSLLLILLLLFNITACTSKSADENKDTEANKTVEENKDKVTFNAGIYTGTTHSMKGNLTVEVTVDNSKILSVEVKDNVDTKGIADTAIDTIPNKIVDGQTLTVDSVSGATVTSMAILSATENALKEAGADVALLKTAAVKTELKKGTDEDYDIVIVGSGASGISAAIQIGRQSDLKVLVLEKLAYYGGSARVCGGGIWSMGSVLNENVGADYSAEEYIAFMEGRSGAELNEELMTNIHDISGDTFNYLIEQGFPVGIEELSLGHPDSQLPVAWSNNHKDYPYETGYGGKQLIDFMVELAEKNGTEFRANSKVTSLEVKSGTVTGVVVEDQDSTYKVNAKKVILATGGFTRNNDLIDELAPDYVGSIPFTGAGSTGDGIIMTKDLDTVIVGEGMMGLPGHNMNLGYYGEYGTLVWQPQIYVNKKGTQFGMEGTFYGETLILLNEQPDKIVYGIADGSHSNIEAFEKAAVAGEVVKAETLEKLADQLEINKENLIAAAKENGLEKAPFYSIEIKPTFIGSIPGLKVTENTEVVNSKNEIIPNLYAVGELTFGNAFSKWYPASGTGIGTSVYTGAIAGQHIVVQLGK